jgi:5-methylcytosine-specific restriction enzyme subunit McrC
VLAGVRDLDLRPAAVDGTFDVRPGSTVGSLSVDGRTMLIRPKIGFARALFLVSYALDRTAWTDDEVELADADRIVDAIASAFARLAANALRRGALQGYRRTEDSLHTVRGQIRVADQIRLRLGIVPPIEVSFDEFTVDIVENRLLRAALDVLRRAGVRSTRVASELRGIEARLEDVHLIEFDPRRLPDVVFTRLNSHYRPALVLARYILRAMSYELDEGEVGAIAFTVEMNRAFEDFVVIALREALGLPSDVFVQGVRNGLWLDDRRRVELRPDMTWWSGQRCVFVGDVKYKRTDLDGESADLYQLLAYVVATGLDRGLLVYAAGEAEPQTHVISLAGKRLIVRALSLSGQPDEILAEVGKLAREVTRLRGTTASEVVLA